MAEPGLEDRHWAGGVTDREPQSEAFSGVLHHFLQVPRPSFVSAFTFHMQTYTSYTTPSYSASFRHSALP